jgi:hypothetical protein
MKDPMALGLVVALGIMALAVIVVAVWYFFILRSTGAP